MIDLADYADDIRFTDKGEKFGRCKSALFASSLTREIMHVGDHALFSTVNRLGTKMTLAQAYERAESVLRQTPNVNILNSFEYNHDMIKCAGIIAVGLTDVRNANIHPFRRGTV
jgi:hypothetical protein